jgi:hypothetical protein
MESGQLLAIAIGIVATFLSIVVGIFQWAIAIMIKGLKENLATICEQNRAEHAEMKKDNYEQHVGMWKRINHHKHDDGGCVVITEGA